MMRLVGALAGALVAAALLATTAHAAPTQGRIVIYSGVEVGADTGIIFGQIFSRRAECRSARRVKLVAASGGSRDVLDKGLSSSEGGISGRLTFDEYESADAVYLLAPKVKRHGRTICARVEELFAEGEARLPGGAAKAVPTAVTIATVGGSGSNGAVAGVLGSGPGGRSCLANREVTLLVDGVKADRGTTTGRGAFALHITEAEFDVSTSIAVRVKRSKLPNGKTCGGGSDSFEPGA